MEGRKMVKVPRIVAKVKDGDIEGDWVTIGVIVDKLPPKDSVKVNMHTHTHTHTHTHLIQLHTYPFFHCSISLYLCVVVVGHVYYRVISIQY